MRALFTFALLAASASLSSAAILTQDCTPSNNNAIVGGVLVNNGDTSVSCAGFTAPSGDVITHITISLFGSFDDALTNNLSHQIVFSGSIEFGPYLYGGIFTGIDNVHAITGMPPTTIRTEDINLAAIAPFAVNVNTSTVGGLTLPSSATYTVSAAYTYGPQSGVPEPGTLALVGGVLVLAGLRKFRS